MKKIALALIASAFTFGAFAQSAAPVAPEAGAHMVKTAAKHKKSAKKHSAKKHTVAKSTT